MRINETDAWKRYYKEMYTQGRAECLQEVVLNQLSDRSE